MYKWKNWDKIDTVVFIIIFLFLQAVAISSTACVRIQRCGGGDLFLYAIIFVGFIPPAFLATRILHEIFRK